MTRPGAVAEWLGRGLQSLVQRFESARRLETVHMQGCLRIFGLTVCAAVGRQRFDCRPRSRPGGVEVDLGYTGRRMAEKLLHGVQVALGCVENVRREGVSGQSGRYTGERHQQLAVCVVDPSRNQRSVGVSSHDQRLAKT